MNSYENQVLRPAVLLALAEVPELVVHVAPVEQLTRMGRRRSPAELGAGTPDLLCSLRWRAQGPAVQTVLRTDLMTAVPIGFPQSPPVVRPYVYGAAWLCLELKAPPCPDPHGVFLCLRCCRPCTDVARSPSRVSSSCCGAKAAMVPRWHEWHATRVQRETHASWTAAGRWVFVVRTPAEALAAVDEARRRLRMAGLEPVAVEGGA